MLADPYGGNRAFSSTALTGTPIPVDFSTDFTVMYWSKPQSGRSTVAFQWPNGSLQLLFQSGMITGNWVHFAITGNWTTAGIDPRQPNLTLYSNGSLFTTLQPWAYLASVKGTFLFGGPDGLSTPLPIFDFQIHQKALSAATIAAYYADRLTNGANTVPPV